MIDENIVKYFDYEETEAIVNLLKATQYIFTHSKDEALLDEILKLSDILISAPLFLKLIDEQLKVLEKELTSKLYFKKISHSPGKLQGSVITWLYYALYWAYGLGNKEQGYEYPQSLSRVVLLFHKYYLKYKENEQKKFSKQKEFRGQDFFEDSAQGLTRALEYMAVMAREDNAYINNVYFPKKDIADLGKHFLEIASSDRIEKNNYYILKQESKDENYLLYENTAEGIRLKVKLSRRIQSGGDEKTEKNRKIVSYFTHDLEQYMKLIELTPKSAKRSGERKKRVNYNRQYTPREDFDDELLIVKKDAKETISSEESQEALQKEKKKYRAIPKADATYEASTKYIQNSNIQRKMNRAFSANVTKKSLKLTVDYYVPIKSHLREFIATLKDDNISEMFTYEDIFFTVFMISCITGMSYEQIVTALFDKDKVVTFDLNEKVVTVKLDETLFAKEKKSEYLKSGQKCISYLLPPLVVILIRKIKLVLELSLSEIVSELQYEILQSKQVNKWYEQYLSEKVKAFDKKIVLRSRQMWRIVEAYKKETLNEEMSTLFCVGKYQIVDRSKMAYASVHNKGQIHARFLISLYEDLGIHDVLSGVLKEDISDNIPREQIDTVVKYAGSSRALEVENSKRFFTEMKILIAREENSRMRFNLIAIYTKYALSILLGTRTFLHSTSLANISFSLHILSVSEKASTQLSGIRVIPLCRRAEQIIRYYQRECQAKQISADNVYMYDGKKIVLYDKTLALMTLSEVTSDKGLYNFISEVPVNTGRHIVTNEARERNFNGYYLETLLGHYGSGEEQLGIFSTLDMKDYIFESRKLMQKIADKYGVMQL